MKNKNNAACYINKNKAKYCLFFYFPGNPGSPHPSVAALVAGASFCKAVELEKEIPATGFDPVTSGL